MRLTIRRKLLANFAIVCTLTVVNAAVVYFKVAELRSRQNDVAKVRIPAIQDINDIRIADQRMVNGLYGYIFITSDSAATEANKKQIAQSRQRVEEDLERLRARSANFNNPENDKRIADIGERLAQLNKTADVIQHEGQTGGHAGGHAKKDPTNQAIHLLSAEAIPSALEMPEAEQAKRMQWMRRVVKEHNIYLWAANLLSDLTEIRIEGADRSEVRQTQ